eukprot:2543381-Rhodomonas_salina.1
MHFFYAESRANDNADTLSTDSTFRDEELLLWRYVDDRKSTGMQLFWHCKRIEIPKQSRHGGTLVGELGEVVKEFVPFLHQVPP